MKQARILVVDDDKGTADLLADCLNRTQKYTAMSATSGAEGVRLALEHKFDLIISDVLMGGIGGEEFLTKLKSLKIQTRFIFMTGKITQHEDTVRLTKLGACDVLHKPVNLPDFELAIDRALILESFLVQESGGPSQSTKDFHDRVELLDRDERAVRRRTYELDKRENDLETRVDLLRRDEREFRQRSDELNKRENKLKMKSVLIPLIFLSASISATVLLYRLGIISGTAPAYLLPLCLFVLLSLPFDRIKTFVAKMKKTEGRATFK